MRFVIFVKRYFKTPLFLIVCLSVVILCFLYQNSDLTMPGNIKVGVYFNGDDKRLSEKLLAKNSYFKYYKYDSIANMKDDVKKKKISYSFSVDFSKEVPFTIFGSDDKFSEVAKEDFYSTYFEILSEKYTRDLLNLNEQDYQKMFDSQINRTYKFKYVEGDVSKIFPLREISAVLLFISMLLVCLDFFNTMDTSDFFATFAGRKSRFLFVSSGMFVNCMVFSIIAFLSSSVNIINFMIYNIILTILAFIIICISDRDIFIKSMPIVVMMSSISIFMSKIQRVRWIYLLFPSNSYLASYSSILTLVIYLVITSIIALLLKFKNRFSFEI